MGYGWNYKRGYGALTAQEQAQIQNLYHVSASEVGAYLMAHTTQIVESCNPLNPMTNSISQAEVVIFQDLNQKLSRDSMIQSVQVSVDDRDRRNFELRLEGCAQPVNYIFEKNGSKLFSVLSACF